MYAIKFQSKNNIEGFWGFGVLGSCLLILLGIRYAHYGGVYPRPYDPPYATRIFYAWWMTFTLFAVAPFVLILADIKDPLQSAAINSGLIFALCLIESTFTHILEPFLKESPSVEAAEFGKKAVETEKRLSETTQLKGQEDTGEDQGEGGGRLGLALAHSGEDPLQA